MVEARLPAGKTLAAFDFENTPMVSKAQVMALAAGDVWLKAGANLLLFGSPDGGKSHLGAAIGLALVENGWRVLFQRTIDLVQRLQTRDATWRSKPISPNSTATICSSSTISLYVSKDRDETSVLFELIAARYERRSLLITANQPFRRCAARHASAGEPPMADDIGPDGRDLDLVVLADQFARRAPRK